MKAEEFNAEVEKTQVNLEQMMFVSNPAMWQEIFGDEQNRIEAQTEFYHPGSQAEFEAMMREFKNPERYSGKPS